VGINAGIQRNMEGIIDIIENLDTKRQQLVLAVSQFECYPATVHSRKKVTLVVGEYIKLLRLAREHVQTIWWRHKYWTGIVDWYDRCFYELVERAMRH